MQNIIKNKRKWIVLGSIFSYLILFILSYLVLWLLLRNHLPIYFPNEQKVREIKFSNEEKRKTLILNMKVDSNELENIQVELYTKSGKKLSLGGVGRTNGEPTWSEKYAAEKGYYYYEGGIPENDLLIVTKNKTKHILFPQFDFWFSIGNY
ncbi:hypothetical protein [Pseudolactococcus reticulitermitis]|uniref:Uncharacterized protein n=1 Tax=Pseudolactococcus reticulitermitis TaxID=2025039 RepID=A0A224X2F9_9LACT|nr:hypothetical protein [Lactococcus reticulitermitis]GAX48328.1 hypothetical protein RsY01_1944 [Lactococcus reticulitermitis]